MSTLSPWLAGIFIPLLPLSGIFNAAFSKIRSAPLRAAILILWPQIGLILVSPEAARLPAGMAVVAVLGSLLYAFRAIAVREMDRWIGYVATSAWALLWLAIRGHVDLTTIRWYALGFSAPLALLTLLAGAFERRFGAAYAGLYGGIAQAFPRLAGITALVVLAVVAVPLFPGFFVVVAIITMTVPVQPWMALSVALTWLLWSWAGVRLLQGLIVGPVDEVAAADVGRIEAGFYVLVLLALVLGGLRLPGILP
ncbi:MAG: hypothetical protein B7Z66_13560 [Chromatiales bacterium 21-64-14]|nr:MAG: hypothetical protein B7Z66_13560 [Chromatiales bacterium 21-64-14]HQU17016.1 proton-conducting transporter membrane subunit [Gammaproteobacteria bacterium]